MNKVVSICLVSLLLLNVMGYYGVFLGVKYQNTQEFIQRLDAELYQESETMTIKIPLSIPYYAETEYERLDGEIEHEGEFYRLVKQKFEKDTLHIVCIKDVKRKHIQKALKDYVKTFADHSADRPHGKTIPSFIKEYFSASFHLDASATGWSLMLYQAVAEEISQEPYLSSPSPPPEG